MKIFDWVHRKMQTNMDYRKVPRHKKDPYVGDETETKKGETASEKAALLMDLRQAASIQQALDEILTIGTLGHVEGQHQEAGLFLDGAATLQQLEFLPLPSLASKLEEQPTAAAAAAAAGDQKADHEGENGDEPAAVEAAAANPAAHPHHHNMVVESFKKEMLEILGADIAGGQNAAAAAGDQEGDLLEPLLQETKASRKERITLADLFMASEDVDVVAVVDPAAGAPKSARPTSARVNAAPEAKSGAVGTKKAKPYSSAPCRAKCGESNSLTKKLTPWKKLEGEDSSTAPQKLQRVIRKMLKKKIHPDMGAREVNAPAPSSTGESSSPSI